MGTAGASGAGQEPSADQAAAVQRYLESFHDAAGGAGSEGTRTGWQPETPVSEVRFVVFDSETTSADARSAALVSLGAVAVRDGEILLEDSYEALLKVAYNSSSVTVHGVTRAHSQESGLDEPDAIAEFLDYLGTGVIVGHHIGFDLAIVGAACQRHFGIELRNLSLDTMELALHLERDGAFPKSSRLTNFSLDALLEKFGVVPHDRHTAPGDAFLTAQVFLHLQRLARKFGRTTLAQVSEHFEHGPE